MTEKELWTPVKNFIRSNIGSALKHYGGLILVINPFSRSHLGGGFYG